jgi:hypothetical protein
MIKKTDFYIFLPKMCHVVGAIHTRVTSFKMT